MDDVKVEFVPAAGPGNSIVRIVFATSMDADTIDASVAAYNSQVKLTGVVRHGSHICGAQLHRNPRCNLGRAAPPAAAPRLAVCASAPSINRLNVCHPYPRYPLRCTHAEY